MKHQGTKGGIMPGKVSGLKHLEGMHRYELMLWLGMAGSSIIFAFLLISYFTTGGMAKLKTGFPPAFYLSTVLLLAGAVVMRFAGIYFGKEEFHNLKNTLATTIYLGVLFGVSQYFGWKGLDLQRVDFSGDPAGSYVYVLSGIHLLHLIGGLVFLSVNYLHLDSLSTDPVKVLVASTDPYEKLKLKLLNRYWYFLDISWVAIFLVLLFSW